MSDEIRGLGVFANIMPFIFLAVAALVLNVLMVRLIEQQRVVIGTFKAIGYSDAQIFQHFTKFGMAIGLLGGLLGLGLGYLVAGYITSLYGMFYEFPRLENRVYPGMYLAALATSLICALVGTLHGARVALRLSPAEAMRPRPPAKGGAIWLERWRGLWRRLSFGWRLVLRNVFRNRFRSAVGIFAASMGAALLVTGFILANAIQYLITFQFDKITRSDVDLRFENERGAEALGDARRLPGVSHAEPILDVACTFEHGRYRRRGAVTGLESGARLTVPRDVDGKPIRIPRAGLAMSRKLAQLLALKPGDTVSVIPVKGRRDKLDMPIAEISDSYIGMAVYADIDYLSRLVGEAFAMTGAQLSVEPRSDVRDSLYRELKRLPALQAVNSRADTIENLQLIVETQRIFIGMIVIFAGVIFFSSVLNASLINLAERRREVATLRVLGYTPWQIGGLFFRESLVVNSMGTLLGLPIGYSIAAMLSRIYDTEMFRFPLVVPPSVWVYTISLAATFAVAAHLVVQRSVHALDWLEASKTME